MVRLPYIPALILLCCLFGSSPPATSLEPNRDGEELTLGTLDHWLGYILPETEELQWQDIPWRAKYWDAIIEGQEKERPILIWAMNGHPLGCT